MAFDGIDQISPMILIHSDDSEIQSHVNNDDFSNFRIWFTRRGGDIAGQLNDQTPQLAIIDTSTVGTDDLKMIITFKQQFNIPIILLINPDDFPQIPLEIQTAVDSIFTKPLQSKQLAVSIHFNLTRLKRERRKLCIPRQCQVVTQHLSKHEPVLINEAHIQTLDKQDFIKKLDGLLVQVDKESTPNVCVKIQFIGAGKEETPQWRKRSLYLQNLIAGYIQQQIRYGDIFALGDDCLYMLLFPGLDQYSASSVTKRILDSIYELINDQENEEDLRAHTGLCIFDGNADVGQIMASANTALGEATQKGNGEIVVNSLLGCKNEGLVKQVSYADIIRNALRDDAFFLHYQPIMSLSDHSIKHYEALIRLQDENANFIDPSKIISAAEQNNQIRDIDFHVMEKVMQKIATFSESQERIKFSVNLSGIHFGDESLLSDICALIDHYGINPSQLVFEVTETAAVKDLKMASHFISSLKGLGCQFGLDDFGTGYASFYYLRALPVDYLKIDGTFVKEMVSNASDQLFIKAIVDVAKGMGIKTIAEYVEDQKTLLYLREYGVDFAQGFHIGKPDVLHLPIHKVPLSSVN
jgi:EAL domain-containing protein (putative c-di-GMP-specific phosphodiesterase class I)